MRRRFDVDAIVTVHAPANAAVPLAELGVEVATNANFTGAIDGDAVGW
jgi:hypothetical protein